MALGFAAVLCAGGGALAVGRAWAEFHPPHALRRSSAVLTQALRDELERGETPATVPALIEFAVSETGRRLHFGLEHRTNLRFDVTAREGNCIEYSELFTRLFNDGVERTGVRARALVVHSERARLLGVRLPGRGMGDHDWALVLEYDERGAEVRRYFVDAAFYDMGLGWDIASSVRGKIELPRSQASKPR
jgi:hypothetical protein